MLAAVAPFLAIIAVAALVAAGLTALGVNWGAVGNAIKGYALDMAEYVGEQWAKFQGYYESDVKPALDNIQTAVAAII